MRRIGLIGGFSWESTAHYYAHLNRLVLARLGGVHSAPVLLHSFDFAPLEELQRKGDWTEVARRLGNAARGLESAGAELLLVCANTMHIVFNEVQRSVGIPLLHIVDPTAAAIEAARLSKVGLLGTAYTMEHSFFKDRLAAFGMEAIVPDDAGRAVCHRIIFEELVKGVVLPESRKAYGTVIQRLVERGAQGIILGCTELSMIVGDGDSPVPAFDTAALHAQAAVDAALDDAAFARLSERRRKDG